METQSDDHSRDYKIEQNFILGVCTILHAIVTVLVNSIAAYYLLVFKKVSLNRKKYNDLLMGLQALMGILLALTGYTWTAVALLTGEWPAGKVGCSVSMLCLLFFGTMTVMITLVMSAERCIAMCFPFYYEQLLEVRKIVVATVCIFIHAGALASLPVILNTVELTKQPVAICLYSLYSQSLREAVVVHAFVSNFSLCILLMLIMNLSVLKALKKMNRSVGVEIRAQFVAEQESIILSKLTGLMALFYSLCWLPIVIRVVLIYHFNWRSTYFDLLAFALSTADPFVHPVTCVLVSQRYRAGYKAVLKHVLSIFGNWPSNRGCESKVQEIPVPLNFSKVSNGE